MVLPARAARPGRRSRWEGPSVPPGGAIARLASERFPADPGKVPVLPTAALLLVALVVTVVGLVDVLREGDGDLSVLFTGLVLLEAAALVSALRGRRGVRLRPDLTAWLTRQAAATGEPVERLADRCVAAYRAGLTGDRQGIP